MQPCLLERVVVFIEELQLAEVTHADIEILRLPWSGAEDADGDPEPEEE